MVKTISKGDSAKFTVNGKTIEISVKAFSPEEARETIKKSDEKFHNRKTRKNVARLYANAMANGEWKTNGDTLRFTEDGTLVDGKTRLEGCSEQDNTIEFLTVKGISVSDVDTIDIGAKRSLENHLQIMCDSYESGAAPIVRAKMALDKGLIGRGQCEANQGITRTEQVEEYDNYQSDYVYAVKFSKRISSETGKALNVSEVGGMYLHLVLSLGWDKDVVEGFFSNFGTVARAEQNIFNTVLKKLGNKATCKGADRTKELIRCWNSYIKNRRSQLVSYSDGDWFATPAA